MKGLCLDQKNLNRFLKNGQKETKDALKEDIVGERGFSMQERGLAFKRKKDLSPSKLTEGRQEEMFLMQINKCRSLWLMGLLISHWILRKQLCQDQGICRLYGRCEKFVGNFHRAACERGAQQGWGKAPWSHLGEASSWGHWAVQGQDSLLSDSEARRV